MNANIPSELLQALLTASDTEKETALRCLRGELKPAEPRHDDGPLFYSVAQAAGRLNVSRSTVWRMIRAGRLRKVELYPGCERIRRADVEALAGVAP